MLGSSTKRSSIERSTTGGGSKIRLNDSLTARNSTIDSKSRAYSVGRNTNRSSIERKSFINPYIRQQSVPPYNKSPYLRTAENKYKPKEFFKAATEFLEAPANRSLGDPD